ncbi:MAG: PxKF domain-containing protein [Pseudomonadota bacterium]
MATPTQITRRGRFGLVLGAVVASIAFSAIAYADDIANKLDASVDAVAEVMPLTVGGANGTTQLYVVPANGDGKSGCNLTGSTSLVLSVASSNPSIATVSPSSVTFGSCGDVKTLTVTPVGQGSATISVSQTSNSTSGTFNLAPATFTVNVVAPPPTNTAPQVAVGGVTGGASYLKGTVPSATCQVTDAEDGSSSFPATLSAVSGPYASDGIGEQTASCSYTDGGGLTAVASETYGIVDSSAPTIGSTLAPPAPEGDNGWYRSDVTLTWSVSDTESPNSLQKTGCVDQSIAADQAETTYSCAATSAGGSTGPVSVSVKRDATLPTITGSASPAANANGWNNTDVTVSFTCADATSGVATCASPQTLSSEGAGQSSGGAATDDAGNSASTTVSGINIDKTAPTATATASPGANGNGWNNTSVTVSFGGTDGLSGIDGCDAAVTLETEGAAQSASGTCTDKAGNVSAAASATVNIDKTAPSVGLVGGPAGGASYYYGSVPAAPTCSASDALSGLDGACSVSGYSAAVGTHTVTASAKDEAGNASSDSVTYTVLAWTLRGFYQPVDMNGVFNVVRNGSTVPLKFEAFAGSSELTDVAAVKSLAVSTVACTTSASLDEIEVTATGGTTLRYDSVGGQFVYNWQTPRQPGQCYRVTMTTQDGSSLVAYFKLK